MSAQTFQMFRVWRRSCLDSGSVGLWIQTACTLKARTDSEAQSKLRRQYARAGFHHMSLVAVPIGVDPNSALVKEAEGIAKGATNNA